MKKMTMCILLLGALSAFANDNCKVLVGGSSQSFELGHGVISSLLEKGYDVSKNHTDSEASYYLSTFKGHCTAFIDIVGCSRISFSKIIRNSNNETFYKELYKKKANGSLYNDGGQVRSERKFRRFIKKLKPCH